VRFARYIAASAFFSRSPASTPSSGKRLTPMLQVIRNSRPATGMGSATAA